MYHDISFSNLNRSTSECHTLALGSQEEKGKHRHGNLDFQFLKRIGKWVHGPGCEVVLATSFAVAKVLKNSIQPMHHISRLPFVKGLAIDTIFHHTYAPQISCHLPDTKAFIMETEFISNPSIAQSVRNFRKWIRRVDSERFACTCRQLCPVLRVGRDVEVGHVCKTVGETVFRNIISDDINFDSRVGIPLDATSTVLALAIANLQKCANATIVNHTLANEVLKHIETDDRSFFYWNDIRRVHSHLSCIQCPALFQRRYVESLFSKVPHAIVPDPNAIWRRFYEYEETVGYIAPVAKIQHHEWGLATQLPKKSSITTKFRPLGSFLKHAFRDNFRANCRSLNFVTSKVAYTIGGAAATIMTCDTKTIRSTVSKFNSRLPDTQRSGLFHHERFEKRELMFLLTTSHARISLML